MTTTLQRSFHLALALSLISALFLPGEMRADTVLEAGGTTVWKFLDEGTEPGAGWQQTLFDDSTWMAGRAPLGYGEQRLKQRSSGSGPDAAAQADHHLVSRPVRSARAEVGRASCPVALRG